jgi:hypothetical protein
MMTPKPRRSKYRATPTVYGGVRFASKAEAARAAELDLLVRAGVVRWWIGQPTFRLGCPENVYRPDFLVVFATGVIQAEEVKGFETAKFRRDRKLWAAYGPVPLVIIKGKTTECILPKSDD